MRLFGIDTVWKYVFRELLGPTVLGLCVYVLVFLMNAMFELAELAIKRDVPATSALSILFFYMPRVLVMTFPMAILLGVLVGVGRMSTDSEVVALRASGVSYWRILYPALTLGLIGWMVCSALILYAEPRANYRRHRIYDQLVYSADLRRQIKPRVFFEEIAGMLVYADEVRAGGDFLDRVLIHQSSEDGEELLTLARRAQIEYDPREGVVRFFLEDGTAHAAKPGDPENYQVSRFERQMIHQGPDESFRMRSTLLSRPPPKNFREQSLGELAQSIARAGSISQQDTRDRVVGNILAVMHERFALPLACVVFAIIGVPLGVMNRRGGKASGFSLSIAIAIVYWVLLTTGQNLVSQGELSPYIGLWLGNALLGTLGIVLFVLRERSEEISFASLVPAPMKTAAAGLLARVRRSAGRREPSPPSPTDWDRPRGDLRTGRVLAWRRGRRRDQDAGDTPHRIVSLQSREIGDASSEQWEDFTTTRSGWKRLRVILLAALGLVLAIVLFSRPRGPFLIVGLVTLAILLIFSTRVDRYILERFAMFFGGSVVSLLFLFAVYDFINLIDDLMERDLALPIVLEYLKYRSPWILAQILPMSCLVATFLAFGIMSRFNELTALKAGGVSIYRMTAPVVVAVLAISMFAYLNHEYLVPHANQRASQIKDTIRGRSPRSYGARERRWVFGEQGQLYNFRNYLPPSRIAMLPPHGTGTFQGMSIYKLDAESFDIQQRVYARSATYQDGTWLLSDGWVREFRDGQESFETFSEKRFAFPETPAHFVREWKTPQQMNYRELRAFVADLRLRGYDVQELAVALYDKTAFPLVSFTIVLLGLPFCFRMGKRGSLYGVGLGVLMVMVYLLIFSTTNALGGVGAMPPFLAAWAPNLLFAGSGVYMLLKSST